MAKNLEIDPIVVQQYVGLLDQYLTDEEYTPYQVSTALNKILAKDGRQPVRSQMMYNYARNGLIVPGEKIAGETLRKITKAEVAMFIIRYCLRNGVQVADGTDVNPDQLELDLYGTEETSN